MVDIKHWIEVFTKKMEETFSERIWFIGLQGSYGRNEANAGSDIDVVVILDELHTEDLNNYRAMLDKLPNRELICGFLSGKAELLNWEPSDLFQFYYDTTPIKGRLDELLRMIDSEAIDRAIRIGACNIYHACVHNIVHERNMELLQGLYKSAAFVVQAIYYRSTGKYIKGKTELLNAISEPEKKILEIGLNLKKGAECDFDSQSEALFAWAQALIKEL